jgi:hypothetical protein
MKNITEYINESLLGMLAGAGAALVAGSVSVSYLIPWIINFIYGDDSAYYPHELIKQWYEDKKLSKIVDRLKSDPDIKQFFSQSHKKQQSGWRDLLKSKLSDDEIKYIRRITKDSIKNKM